MYDAVQRTTTYAEKTFSSRRLKGFRFLMHVGHKLFLGSPWRKLVNIAIPDELSVYNHKNMQWDVEQSSKLHGSLFDRGAQFVIHSC